MKRFRACPVALFVCYFPVQSVGMPDQAAITARDIPRFQAVAEGVYRGGQPTRAGFECLKQKGIKTIINLRLENGEEGLVEKLGMKYIQIPISAWRSIPDEAIRTFFCVLSDPANRPIFIHCKRGSERTGVMVGFYRIAHQGWDGQRAYEEAQAMGMRWWHRGLKRQLYHFSGRQAVCQSAAARD